MGHGIPPSSPRFPGALPRASSIRTDAGLVLQLSPPSTLHQISILGRQYCYSFYARHQVGSIEPDSAVSPADRGLLQLRAQAEASRELAARNVVKPNTITVPSRWQENLLEASM